MDGEDVKINFNLADGYDSHWLLNLENHMKTYNMYHLLLFNLNNLYRKGPKFHELPPKLQAREDKFKRKLKTSQMTYRKKH